MQGQLPFLWFATYFSDIVINAGHVDTEAKVALHATVCKQPRRKQVLNLSIWPD